MNKTDRPKTALLIGAEKVRKPLAVFDATLVVIMAAFVVAAVVVLGNGSSLLTLLAAAGTAAVVATASLTLSRRDRGVFLTPTLRVVFLIAAAGSLGLCSAPQPVTWSPRPPTSSTGSAAAMFNIQEHEAALEGEIAAKTAEAKYLHAALDKSGAERDEALRLANENLIETERLREQERERQTKQSGKEQIQQQPTTTAEPPTEKQLLARGWKIPENQVQLQKQAFVQDPFGRNVIDAILGKAALLGPELGSLFGGGRTQSVTIRVVEKLQGGTLPAEQDLSDMFLATVNPAKLTSDLFNLIDSGVAGGVIKKEEASAMKDKIDSIRNAATLPVSSDAEKARDRITTELAAGKRCSRDLTRPEWDEFASTAEKRKLIATTTDEATKSCLNQYPAKGSAPTK